MAENVLRHEDASTIVSLLPVAIKEHKPGLHPAEYKIPAVKDPKTDLELLIVKRATFPVYIDENRPALIVQEPSDRVATAICRDLKVSMSHFEPDIAEPGLFWVPGIVSKKDFIGSMKSPLLSDVLEKARTLQMEWFRRLVSAADDDWGQWKMRKMISKIQHQAAEILGLEREWNINNEITEAQSVCKFCFSQVNPMAIVCGSCQGILDMTRYEREFVKAGTVAKHS
jgi:hypothetical protein